MSGMRVSFALRLPIGATLGALISATAYAAELPPGPNRELVLRTCTACHDIGMLLGAAGADREAWDGAIDQMIGNGLNITTDDRAKILEYLATALGPDATVANR